MKNVFVSPLALALALSSGLAQAADPNWYVGGGVGYSKVKFDTSGIVGSKDETSTAWKVFGGYQINRYMGVEAGYVDLGKASFNGRLSVAEPPFPVGTATSGDFDSNAFFLTAVGAYPVTTQFSVLAKLGVSRAETDARVTLGGLSASTTGRTTQATYGLGVRFDINKSFAVRGEWDRFRVGGGILDKENVDVFSINAIFKF